MFKRLSGLIFGAICLVSCSAMSSEEEGMAVHYDLNNSTVSVECKGNVEFEPVEGITRVILEDLKAIADEVCGSPAASYKEHLSSELDDSIMYLKSAKVVFSCQGELNLETTATEKLSRMCKDAFETFDAQQE